MAATSETVDPPGPRLWRLAELTEFEKGVIRELRERVEGWAEKEEGFATDDHTLLRFLVARGWSVDQALAMYTATMLWRKETQPQQMIAPERASQLIEVQRMKAVWWREPDVFGRPVLLGWAARHLKNFPSQEEKTNHAMWALETATERCRANPLSREGGPASYFVVLGDLSGLGMANVDYGFFQNMINLLQQYYPEQLGAFYVCNAGWLFNVIWKVVRPWLDKRTASKIFVNPTREELLALLPAEHLPLSFGGDADDTDFGKAVPPGAPKP